MIKTRAPEEGVSVSDEAVISAEAAKVEESFHCTVCQPGKSGYKLSHNVFDAPTGKLTHVFLNEKGERLEEPCGGKQ